MSDVSKTSDLIAEAQEHYSEMNGLNSRAAEVMMELVAALEAKTGVRVDMSSAVGVETQLAATRVPVQGEPNSRARQIDEAAPDAREHLHAKCDCVPDLGPAHCHLCTGKGAPVKWEDCEAVREIADAPEPVDVVLTTADIEKLAHLLVQLSPATQRNSGATVRRLMQEMNIKEVSK